MADAPNSEHSKPVSVECGVMGQQVKCWQITPYHNNQADYAIFPIRGEQSHHDALEYAKDRLTEQWDATAHDETIKPAVAMEIVIMTEDEIPEMVDP